MQWIYAGRRITLVDTAGVKVGKRNETVVDAKVQEEVHEAVKYSHVVAIMIDSMEAFTSADMSLVQMVLDEGRAVVIIANKWDLVDEKYKKKAVKWMEK